MYGSGRGVPKDEAKAVQWFQKAAAQGHAEAKKHLGIFRSLIRYFFGKNFMGRP
jgi:TPR repeat protein